VVDVTSTSPSVAVGPFAEAEPDRFTEWLRARSDERWDEATGHRFTEELADGTLEADVLRRYLLQDYVFLREATGLVAAAAADAPDVDSRGEIAEFLAMLCSDENDYFRRAFEELGVPESTYEAPDLTPTTEAFLDLVHRAENEGGYAESLAVFVPAEWVYLEWGRRADERADDDLPFTHREWIDLHAEDSFVEFVTWLRGELDRVGPDLAPRRQRHVARLFERTVDLEVAFFEAAYVAGPTDSPPSPR
jgi:thiaminase/transcriptional activator TenA